ARTTTISWSPASRGWPARCERPWRSTPASPAPYLRPRAVSRAIMTCVLIDYGSGNIRSAAKALERAAAESGLGTPIVVTDSPDALRDAERIVLPGVGAFADCMSGLSALPGMREALEEAVIARGHPFLGICVGLQLIAERRLAHGSHPGLGWIEGT